MPDGNSANSRRTHAARAAAANPDRKPGAIGILREGVQDVGEEQLLVLLLVMQADLEDAAAPPASSASSATGKQPLDRVIDMGAVRGDVCGSPAA